MVFRDHYAPSRDRCWHFRDKRNSSRQEGEGARKSSLRRHRCRSAGSAKATTRDAKLTEKYAGKPTARAKDRPARQQAVRAAMRLPEEDGMAQQLKPPTQSDRSIILQTNNALSAATWRECLLNNLPVVHH